MSMELVVFIIKRRQVATGGGPYEVFRRMDVPADTDPGEYLEAWLKVRGNDHYEYALTKKAPQDSTRKLWHVPPPLVKFDFSES